MLGAALPDVVIAKRPSILELLAGKDQTLLVGRDSLLVLDLSLDVLDRVGGLDLYEGGSGRNGGCRGCRR